MSSRLNVTSCLIGTSAKGKISRAATIPHYEGLKLFSELIHCRASKKLLKKPSQVAD
jgi:hypothetical protein